jgi:hypothetical protein
MIKKAPGTISRGLFLKAVCDFPGLSVKLQITSFAGNHKILIGSNGKSGDKKKA